MTKNLDKEGLRSIVDNYQLFYIDLWGVIHNGIKLHEEAINVLKEISKNIQKIEVDSSRRFAQTERINWKLILLEIIHVVDALIQVIGF